MLQFTNESKDEIIYIMKMYNKYIGNIKNRNLRKQIANEVITKYKEDNNYTKGLTLGVLIKSVEVVK